MYSISEIYESIQGEGVHTGERVVIVRFSGCNLSCEWCDTDHSPNLILTAEQIVSHVSGFHARAILLTGGEPTIQDIAPLCKELRKNGYKVYLETNGTTSLKNLRDYVDWIAISPKVEARPENARYADEVKVIASDDLDLTDIETWSGVPYRFLVPCDYNDGRGRLSSTIAMLAQINDEMEDMEKWVLMQQVHKQLMLR